MISQWCGSRLFRLSLTLAHLIVQATFAAHFHRLQSHAISSSEQTALHESQLSPDDCKLCDLNTASTANISADDQFSPIPLMGNGQF
jgi:hypothetical protein